MFKNMSDKEISDFLEKENKRLETLKEIAEILAKAGYKEDDEKDDSPVWGIYKL